MAKRENGSGWIRTVKGANGTRYYAYAPARYEIQEDGTTKCIREPIGQFEKKADAKAALAEYQKHPVARYKRSLEDVYSEWSKTAFPDISRSTKDNYTSAWNQIALASPKLLTTPLRDISTADLRSTLDFWLEDHDVVTMVGGKLRKKSMGPLSRSSMEKIRCVYTQLYKYACANNLMDKNLAEYVKIPKDAVAGKKRAFTDGEVQQLLSRWMYVPGGDAVLALVYTGFRITEFCQLTPASFDAVACTLTGGIKTDAGRDRVVPVHPVILPLVKAWARRGGQTLYCKPDGTPHTADSFRRLVWWPAMQAMDLPDDLTPHCARHTFATRLSAAGARPEDIQRLMGHTDFSMTANVYINQDVAPLSQAVNLLK